MGVVVRGAAAPKGAMTYAVFIGQRPRRGQSPVEHRGTIVRPEMANGLKWLILGLRKHISGLRGLERAWEGWMNR